MYGRFGRRLVRRRVDALRPLVLDMERADDRHLADGAAADELGRFAGKRGRAALQPDLHHPVGAPRGVHHGPPFPHHEGQRLLDVDVLARLAGVDCLQRVPVVGGADGHRVEILEVEELPVVLELSGLTARFLGGEVEVGLVQVAKGHDFEVGVLQEGIEHLVAPVAQSNEAHANAIVRAEHAAACDGGADPGRRGRAAELPAGEGCHGRLLELVTDGGKPGGGRGRQRVPTTTRGARTRSGLTIRLPGLPWAAAVSLSKEREWTATGSVAAKRCDA